MEAEGLHSGLHFRAIPDTRANLNGRHQLASHQGGQPLKQRLFDPCLTLRQCSVPEEMAVTLFRVGFANRKNNAPKLIKVA